jgi:hypothetical protein
MNFRIEIADEQATCYQDGRSAFSAPLKDFVSALVAYGDHRALPEPAPDGVRDVRARGDVKILVMEEKPQVRTVRWLADESPVPFGRGAIYRTARLAFPFIVTVLAFRAGGLTGYQQCFYRTEPLAAWSDPLFFPNLYNVADGYGQQCWLCLVNVRPDLAKLSWNDKVDEIRRHLWGAGFNKSSEMHEGMSYWSAMQTIDPRFKSLDAWEEASQRDPVFPLEVRWKPCGRTIGDVIDMMLERVAPRCPQTITDLVQVLSLAARHPAGRPSSVAR